MSELRPRTKKFAVPIFRFCDTLPARPSVQVIRRQLMRSASSTGANYRVACHAQSRAEFLAKMSVAEEEADETEYWLE
ncbi:MAG: four helix bundle protein, partial [Bacteroidetes bacterium QH_2_63_10]